MHQTCSASMTTLHACRFFEAGACELRIGVYESFDTLCIYLESDALASPERNFWVKYRIAVVNQRHPDRTEWKDSAICTKTWNNSVLQFMKVCSRPSDVLTIFGAFCQSYIRVGAWFFCWAVSMYVTTGAYGTDMCLKQYK